jgi:hypothetical protein
MLYEGVQVNTKVTIVKNKADAYTLKAAWRVKYSLARFTVEKWEVWMLRLEMLDMWVSGASKYQLTGLSIKQ